MRAVLDIEKLKKKHGSSTDEVAIVSMSCRFAGGADSPQKFGELLSSRSIIGL